MYTVNDQNKRGVPDIIREAKVNNIRINGIDIPYERTIVYKYNDDVWEVYNYLDIVPDVTTAITDKVLLLKIQKTKQVGVKIKAGKDNIKGNLQPNSKLDCNTSKHSVFI
jgi:hypothetical protein